MTFFKSIKTGSLKGAYALHGEEEFVKESALKSLTSSLDEATRDLNLQILEKAEADDIVKEFGKIEVDCQYCDKKYIYRQKDVDELFLKGKDA